MKANHGKYRGKSQGSSEDHYLDQHGDVTRAQGEAEVQSVSKQGSTGFHLQQGVSSTPPLPTNGFLKPHTRGRGQRKSWGGWRGEGGEYYMQLPSCCYGQMLEGSKEKKGCLSLVHNFRGAGQPQTSISGLASLR